MIKTLSIDVPFTMLENVVYAMPTRSTTAFVVDPASVVQVRMLADSGAWETLTISDGYFATAAPFIRTTDATCEIICRVI